MKRCSLPLVLYEIDRLRSSKSVVEMTFDANAIFEKELLRRGVSFVRKSEHEYTIDLEGWEVTANLINARRNAERDQNADAIKRFVDHVLATRPSTRPQWSEASTLLFFSAESADQDFGDAITSVVTSEIRRVLTLTDKDETKITWVSSRMCDDWGVTTKQATSAAAANQNRLLDGIQLEIGDVDGHALGMVPIESPYKASVIFAGNFKKLVEPMLGWPVLVVVPCRDFIYVMADNSPILQKLGSVVVNEFRNSGYPITTEVLRITDEGIEAIGKYPA